MRLDLHSLLPRFVLGESAKAADSIRAAIAGYDLGGNHLGYFLYRLVNGRDFRFDYAGRAPLFAREDNIVLTLAAIFSRFSESSLSRVRVYQHKLGTRDEC